VGGRCMKAQFDIAVGFWPVANSASGESQFKS
jgi:hypothetical protein